RSAPGVPLEQRRAGGALERVEERRALEPPLLLDEPLADALRADADQAEPPARRELALLRQLLAAAAPVAGGRAAGPVVVERPAAAHAGARVHEQARAHEGAQLGLHPRRGREAREGR